jgi:mannose-6-phosphate isomerase-like protein (cupin superfamily)
MFHLQQHRRKLLKSGIFSFLTAMLVKIPNIGFSQTTGNPGKGFIVHAGEGEKILTRRKAQITLKISREKHGVESMTFCTEEIIQGRKLRVHRHHYHDELIFIHKGMGRFTLGEEEVNVETGSVVFVPKGVWHALENTGKENITMLFSYSPAGFEGYFRENGTALGMPYKIRTEEELKEAREKYGMEYKTE